MTVTCNKCGIVKGFIEEKGNQTGLYCNKCGKWIKWLTKDEKRIFAHNNKSKMTNADRIRSMTDEELAEFIARNNYDCANYCEDAKCGCSWSCGNKDKTIALQWLQKESEE